MRKPGTFTYELLMETKRKLDRAGASVYGRKITITLSDISTECRMMKCVALGEITRLAGFDIGVVHG